MRKSNHLFYSRKESLNEVFEFAQHIANIAKKNHRIVQFSTKQTRIPLSFFHSFILSSLLTTTTTTMIDDDRKICTKKTRITSTSTFTQSPRGLFVCVSISPAQKCQGKARQVSLSLFSFSLRSSFFLSSTQHLSLSHYDWSITAVKEGGGGQIYLDSGSLRIPSTSNLRRASSRAHVCILLRGLGWLACVAWVASVASWVMMVGMNGIPALSASPPLPLPHPLHHSPHSIPISIPNPNKQRG